MKNKKKTSFYKIKFLQGWFKALVLSVLLILFIRVFIFQSFLVTDSKMEPSLLSGDYVLVSKLNLSARIDLPYLNKSNYRIKEITNIKRNNILLFNYPTDSNKIISKKEKIFKRCVALPHDTLNIVDKKVFVNNICTDVGINLKYRFKIVSNKNLNKIFFESNNINEGGVVDSPFVYNVFITKQNAQLLAQLPAIKEVNLIKLPKSAKSSMFFPNNKVYNWNLDYFGPLVIPAKDDTIHLDLKNIDIYKKIICDYENNKLQIIENDIYINNVKTKIYVTKMNYYFTLDDNRDNGKDSRYFGFVPENHILGKAVVVLFSFNKQFNFFERIFHFI